MRPRIRSAHPDLAEFLASDVSSEEYPCNQPSALRDPQPAEEVTDPLAASPHKHLSADRPEGGDYPAR